MKKNETASFKQIIRDTFMAYSIVPVFLASCIAFILLLSIRRYSVVQSNESENKYATNRMISMLDACANELEKFEDYELVDIENNSDVKKDVFTRLYALNNIYGLEFNFYILDSSLNELFKFGDDAPKYLTNEEYGNWGIIKYMKNKPGEVKVTIMDENLCVGIASAVSEGRFYYVFSIPKSNISSLFKSEKNQLIITDQMDWVYYSNQSAHIDSIEKLMPELENSEGFVKLGDERLCIRKSLIENYGIKVITISDMNINESIIVIIVIAVTLIFLAIIVFTFFSTTRMAEKYTHDIDEIAKALELVQNGDLEVKLRINSSKEFQAIGRDFNSMTEGLKYQIEQNKEMVELVAFAQVKQLESQFNPHFLFNTLDNIRFMTKMDLNAADKMIVSLSKLLRYSIRDPREILTVREDLDNLQSYFNILQIRFNKRFSYEIQIDDEIMSCLIPKLLIQPLIENAVKYGFVNRDTLHVTITGFKKDDNIVFRCIDDGAGIGEELLEELRSQLKQEKNTTGHSGLYNIHRRIYLLYRGDYGVKIHSEIDKGTIIELVMPCRRYEEKC